MAEHEHVREEEVEQHVVLLELVLGALLVLRVQSEGGVARGERLGILLQALRDAPVKRRHYVFALHHLLLEPVEQRCREPGVGVLLLHDDDDAEARVDRAEPGVRTKGTKNKIGLQEAFADRHEKGYTWNNLMLSKWVDHDGNEHRVLEDYERNRLLVDLHAQPDAIVEELDQTIEQAKAENKSIDQVGIRFMRLSLIHI